MMSMAIRTNTLLSAENVCVTLGGKQILHDVTFKVNDLVRTDSAEVTGQVVAILGRSGSGKSTLLRVLAGLLEPTSGNVFLGVERTPVHAGLVGMVTQKYEVFRHRTVLGNLMLAARQSPDHSSGKQAEERAFQMLELFELTDKSNSYPSELSGGQRQRIAIAQQIISSSYLLLMDEPTAGLDPVIKKKVCNTISKTANRSEIQTIVLVTHDIPAAVAVADTIILLGCERTPEGVPVPGACVVGSIDLVEREIPWHEDVRKLTAYKQTVEEIQDWFEKL